MTRLPLLQVWSRRESGLCSGLDRQWYCRLSYRYSISTEMLYTSWNARVQRELWQTLCVHVPRSLKLSMPSCRMLLETEDHCGVKCCGFHTLLRPSSRNACILLLAHHLSLHQVLHFFVSGHGRVVFEDWIILHIYKERFILWQGQLIFLKWSIAHQTHLVVYAASQWLDCMTEFI